MFSPSHSDPDAMSGIAMHPSGSQSYLRALPPELLHQLALYMDTRELLAWRLACRLLHDFANCHLYKSLRINSDPSNLKQLIYLLHSKLLPTVKNVKFEYTYCSIRAFNRGQLAVRSDIEPKTFLYGWMSEYLVFGGRGEELQNMMAHLKLFRHSWAVDVIVDLFDHLQPIQYIQIDGFQVYDLLIKALRTRNAPRDPSLAITHRGKLVPITGYGPYQLKPVYSQGTYLKNLISLDITAKPGQEKEFSFLFFEAPLVSTATESITAHDCTLCIHSMFDLIKEVVTLNHPVDLRFENVTVTDSRYPVPSGKMPRSAEHILHPCDCEPHGELRWFRAAATNDPRKDSRGYVIYAAANVSFVNVKRPNPAIEGELDGTPEEFRNLLLADLDYPEDDSDRAGLALIHRAETCYY